MPILISAELSSKGEILVKLLKKYVLIIYALGSVLACPGRSDSGVRREGSEWEKKYGGKEGVPRSHPFPTPSLLLLLFFLFFFLCSHLFALFPRSERLEQASSVHEKFGVWKSRSEVAPNAKFPAGLGEKNGWAVLDWNRRSLLIQTPNFSRTQFNV